MKSNNRKQFIRLVGLGLVLALSGKAYAADIDCTLGSIIVAGSNGTTNKLMGNCSDTLAATGSTTNGILYYHTSNNTVRVGGNVALPALINPHHLGDRISKQVIDVGITKPNFTSCLNENYDGANTTTPIADGHWYCAKFVGSDNTGYLYAQFISPALGFKQPILLDIDADGKVEVLTDGLLVLRYLFGFRDDNLINDVVATLAYRKNAVVIQEYLASITTGTNVGSLDIDDDNNLDALTDGLLILRYLFGFTGANLIDGAVASTGAGRTNAADIEAYLETLVMP